MPVVIRNDSNSGGILERAQRTDVPMDAFQPITGTVTIQIQGLATGASSPTIADTDIDVLGWVYPISGGGTAVTVTPDGGGTARVRTFSFDIGNQSYEQDNQLHRLHIKVRASNDGGTFTTWEVNYVKRVDTFFFTKAGAAKASAKKGTAKKPAPKKATKKKSK